MGGDFMGSITKRIEIEASPEDVFNFITDFDSMNSLHAGFTEAHPTSNGPIGVGTTAHFVGKHGGSTSEWDMEITEFEKNKKVKWQSKKPVNIANTLTLEPTSNGTILKHDTYYEVPYSVFGKIVDKLKVSKDVDKEITLELDNTKKALEERKPLTSAISSAAS